VSTVLVTGCRSGFGLGITASLVGRGHTVYAGLRDPTTDADLQAACAAGPGRLVVLALDVTDDAQRRAAAQRIEQDGGLDALVNNAGVGLGAFSEQIDEDEFRKVFEVNVVGLWALSNAVLPLLRASRGSLIHIGSMQGVLAFPGLAAYAASKFAVEGLAEAQRHELAPFGVRVHLVQPGPYKTDIFTRNRSEGRRLRDPDSPYAPIVARMDARVEQHTGRAGDPQEVADRVVALIEGRQRGLRHPIGPGARARVWVKRLLPFAAVEWAVQRVLRG
jgi:NAD(P)-dependent dehydrogenase (short-subunit alcohol dehydrogenase family)